MNKGTQKNRKKRAHSPQEPNNSFVKNVTSTVSYLFPSSITKWFSRPTTSNANGSAQVASATDSSSEDEMAVAQPPPKRMCYNSAGKMIHIGQSDVICTAANVGSTETLDTIQSPQSKKVTKRDLNYVSTPVHSRINEPSNEKHEQDAIAHTSQHSLLMIGPSVSKVRKLEKFDMLLKDLSQEGSDETTSTMKKPLQPSFKPSLLTSPFYVGNTMYGGAASSYMNQPNIQLCRSTMVNKALSPNDNTISHSTRRVMDLLEQCSPLTEARRISQFITSSKNESLNYNTENQSTRGSKSISYKTQELHVPSIASILSLKQRSRFMDTTNTARQLIASQSSTSSYTPYPTINKQSGFLNKDCNDKCMTKMNNKITRPKKREITELNNDMSTQFKLPNAVLEIDPNNLPEFNFGSPMVSESSCSITHFNTTPLTKISNLPLKINNVKDSDQGTKIKACTPAINSKLYNIPPVAVSNNTTLSSSMQEFTYDEPSQNIEETKINKEKNELVSSALQQEGTGNVLIEKTEGWKCSVCSVVNKANVAKCVSCSTKQLIEENSYKFSTPVMVSKDMTVSSSMSKFTFEKPRHNIEEANVSREINNTIALNFQKGDGKDLAEKSKDWKCFNCWVFNKANASNCVCCSSKKPSAGSNSPLKCSICKNELNRVNAGTICPKCEMAQITNNNKYLVPSSETSSWKCADCWVSNNQSADTCVCCGGKNPKHSASTQNKSNDTGHVWNCNDCLINNKSNIDKCTACGALQPVPKSHSKLIISLTPAENLMSSSFKSDHSFINIIKKQADKWECTNCMVRNNSDKAKCVCCDFERPGVTKETQPKSFQFGITAKTTFKFGVDLEAQNDSTQEMESDQNSQQSSKNEEWETNNNILAETPSFTFGLLREKKEPLTENVETTAEIPKVNFSFGIPKQINSVPSAGLILHESDSKEQNSASVSTEKPQEVPSIAFTLPETQNVHSANNVSKNNMFPINNIPSSVTSQEPLNSVGTDEVLDIMTEEKNVTFNPLIIQTTASIETNKPNTFTCAKTGVNFASHLFSTPTVTEANLTTSNNSLISVPKPITSSFFQKSDPNVIPPTPLFKRVEHIPATTNLFQKPETITSNETAPSFTISKKLFSFGNSTQSSLSQSEKPKFNFSFGNTQKADAPNPTFNATFGETTTSNSSNKFTLPIVNGIGTGSTLLGSTLSSGGALATGNSVISDNLVGNNGLSTGNPLNVTEMGNNSLNTRNSLASSSVPTTASSGIFTGSTQVQQWSNRNSTSGNLFASNAAPNPLQRSPTFSFGSTTPFNANNTGAVFRQSSNVSVFAMPPRNSRFANSTPNQTPNQTAPNIFGNPQTTSTATSMSVFGSANVPAANNFNAVNRFEAPAQNPVSAPSFGFGTQRPSTGSVFGFGQHQQQQPVQNAVYNFGANQAAPQFNIGIAPSTSGRRVRRAVRRTQR